MQEVRVENRGHSEHIFKLNNLANSLAGKGRKRDSDVVLSAETCRIKSSVDAYSQ